MPAPTSASRHYRRLQRLKAITIAGLRRSWGRMDPGGSWERQYATEVGPQVNALMLGAQVAATRESDAYAADVLNELGFGPRTEAGVVAPNSLAGVAGDGRSVETLLASTVGRARALSATMPPDQALDEAQSFMDMVAETLIADAARAAEEVAMAERPWVAGYVRMINPPCCSRCALLSGKFYPFSDGFLRHPRCDCYHLPAPDNANEVRDLVAINSPERYFESLSEAEQDRIFTTAGAQAIREGADMGQVVNARRGMTRAQLNGREVLATTAGTSRRRRAGQVRLMPESILEVAGSDRDEARRLLRLYGYLL